MSSEPVGARPSPPVGKHLYANLYDIDPSLLSNENLLVRTIVGALEEGGLRPIEVRSWSFGGRKGGVSVIVLLEGAHVIVHTWTEYGYATLDVLITGEVDPRVVFERMSSVLKPRSYKVSFVYRGAHGDAGGYRGN